MNEVQPFVALPGMSGTGQFGEAGIQIVELSVFIDGEGDMRQAVDQGAKLLFALGDVLRRHQRLAPVAQAAHHCSRHDAQPLGLDLAQTPGPRLGIDDAKRTERCAFARNQRRAGIEADVGMPGDERIIVEARVLPRIGHYQRFGL